MNVGRKSQLLVVGDDAREIVTLILEQCGAEVITAESSQRASPEYNKHQPDISIGDISMPVEDGLSLIEQIRNSGSTKSNLPAIAFTLYFIYLRRSEQIRYSNYWSIRDYTELNQSPE